MLMGRVPARSDAAPPKTVTSLALLASQEANRNGSPTSTERICPSTKRSVETYSAGRAGSASLPPPAKVARSYHSYGACQRFNHKQNKGLRVGSFLERFLDRSGAPWRMSVGGYADPSKEVSGIRSLVRPKFASSPYPEVRLGNPTID
jgi:hypothetical protein